MIDTRLKPDEQEAITPGEAIKGMMINGLGFANRPLSLTPQFFAGKPLDLLFRPGVEATMFNRFKLGRTLDEVKTYGCDLLFSEIALAVCGHEAIDQRFHHLDTTSFSPGHDVLRVTNYECSNDLCARGHRTGTAKDRKVEHLHPSHPLHDARARTDRADRDELLQDPKGHLRLPILASQRRVVQPQGVRDGVGEGEFPEVLLQQHHRHCGCGGTCCPPFQKHIYVGAEQIHRALCKLRRRRTARG